MKRILFLGMILLSTLAMAQRPENVRKTEFIFMGRIKPALFVFVMDVHPATTDSITAYRTCRVRYGPRESNIYSDELSATISSMKWIWAQRDSAHAHTTLYSVHTREMKFSAEWGKGEGVWVYRMEFKNYQFNNVITMHRFYWRDLITYFERADAEIKKRESK